MICCLKQASVQTYTQVLSKMQKQLTVFQKDALADSLSIPKPPLTEVTSCKHPEAQLYHIELLKAALACVRCKAFAEGCSCLFAQPAI